MTAPQTPPPCPVAWCTTDHQKTKAAYHARTGFSVGNACIVIAQYAVDEKPGLLLSDYSDAMLRIFDSGHIRMLAKLAKPDIAKALRQAADELDRIGGGQ